MLDDALSCHTLWGVGYWLPQGARGQGEGEGEVEGEGEGGPQPEALVRRAQQAGVAGRELAGLTRHVHLRRWEIFIEVSVGPGGCVGSRGEDK